MGMANGGSLVGIVQEQLAKHGYAHGSFSSVDQAIQATGLESSKLDRLQAIRNRLYDENTAAGLLWDVNFLQASEFYKDETRMMSIRPAISHSAGISLVLDEELAEAKRQHPPKTKRDARLLQAVEVAVPPHDFPEDIVKKRTKEITSQQPASNEATVRASVRANELSKLKQFYENLSSQLSKDTNTTTRSLKQVWHPALMTEGLLTRGSYSAKWQANNYFTYMLGMDQRKIIAGDTTRILHNFLANTVKTPDFIDNIPDLFPDTSYLKLQDMINHIERSKADELQQEISPQRVSEYRRILEESKLKNYSSMKPGFQVKSQDLMRGFRSLGLDVRESAGRAENIMWSVLRNDRGYYWVRRVAQLDSGQRRKAELSDTALALLYNLSTRLSKVIKEVSQIDMNHHFVYNTIHRRDAQRIEDEVDEYMQTPYSREFTIENPDGLPAHLKPYDSFTRLAIDIVDDKKDIEFRAKAQYRGLCVSNRLATRYLEENSGMDSIEEYKELYHIDGDIEKAASAGR